MRWRSLVALATSLASVQDCPSAARAGIAYDALGQRLFVTGKLWPRVFEIKVQPYAQGQVPTWASVRHLCWPQGFI